MLNGAKIANFIVVETHGTGIESKAEFFGMKILCYGMLFVKNFIYLYPSIANALLTHVSNPHANGVTTALLFNLHLK